MRCCSWERLYQVQQLIYAWQSLASHPLPKKADTESCIYSLFLGQRQQGQQIRVSHWLEDGNEAQGNEASNYETQAQVWILSLRFMLCSTGAKEATGNTVMPILQNQPPFSWASLSASTASLLSSLLATPAHTPSHSRCWNSLPFLMRVPECLIKVVQPSKSESFTVGRADIYSINKRWVPARGRRCWSLGHREHETGHWSTWNCLASDCSCYSQTSHSQWQYAQCFIQCKSRR